MKPESKQKLKNIFPPLGMRILKTALSLFVAMIISDYFFKHLLKLKDIDTNSVCVFAVLSVQDSVKGTRKFIFERLLGNVLGLAMGFLFLFLFTLSGTKGIKGDIINGNFVFFTFVAVGALITIYLCKMLRRVSASVITILVFLGIMFAAASDMNPYLKGAYNVLQMSIGIVIAVTINLLILPPKTKQDCDCKTPPPADGTPNDDGLEHPIQLEDTHIENEESKESPEDSLNIEH